MNAVWSAAGGAAGLPGGADRRIGRGENVRARKYFRAPARQRASQGPATGGRASEPGSESGGLRGIVDVEVIGRVATARPEGDLGRERRRPGWLGGEAEVGEDDGDDGRVGERGQDPHDSRGSTSPPTTAGRWPDTRR